MKRYELGQTKGMLLREWIFGTGLLDYANSRATRGSAYTVASLS